MPSPTLDASLVSVPEMAITATITTMPMTVPTSAATRTLIIGRALYQLESDDHTLTVARPRYPLQGMLWCPSNDEVITRMLDRRDIQTLMYCVRLTEVSGQWQSGYPVRTPHELECKLAELLRQVETRTAASRAA